MASSVNLDVDEAYLNVTTTYPTSVWMYYMTEECYKCPYERLAEIRSHIRSGEKNTFFVSTKFHNMWRFYKRNMGKYVPQEEKRNLVCELSPKIGEFGIYDFVVGANENCEANVVRPPINSNLAILYFLLIVAAIYLLIRGICLLKNRWHTEDTFVVNEKQQHHKNPSTRRNRLLSVDTFRGICVVLMVFINSGGGSYWWIGHSEWNGATMPDFIFPSFLFLMGFCIPLSIYNRLAKKETKCLILIDIIKRSAILFLVGVCESSIGEIHLEKIQVRGVIQRFAVAYLIIASLYLWLLKHKHQRHMEDLQRDEQAKDTTDTSSSSCTTTSSSSCTPCGTAVVAARSPNHHHGHHNPHADDHDDDDRIPSMFSASGPEIVLHHHHHDDDPLKPSSTSSHPLHDFLILWPLWLFALLLVAVHLVLLLRLPVPGCPLGYMGPGGKQLMGRYQHCMGGTVGYIDYLLLGNETSTNLNGNNGITAVYEAVPLNPFNVFGNLLTIVQVFLGLQCGLVFMLWRTPRARFFRLLPMALVCGVVAGCLCGWSRDGGVIPVNQTMWSLSYTLASHCVATLCFALCYGLVDVCRVWREGRPFVYAGMNSLLVFVGHEAIGEMLPFHWKISRMDSHFVILLENGWTTMVWLGISYLLYRRGIFINP